MTVHQELAISIEDQARNFMTLRENDILDRFIIKRSVLELDASRVDGKIPKEESDRLRDQAISMVPGSIEAVKLLDELITTVMISHRR